LKDGGNKEEMIKVLATGTIMVDILAVELERIANPGEIAYLNREVEARIGGHPIDVGIDLVKLGHNPEEIGVIAAIGKGLFGDYSKKIIGQYGLRSFLQEIEKTDTGKNIVLEKKGEDRRFHIDPGANWYLAPEFVRTNIRELSPRVFCVRPGYCGIDLHLKEIFREVKTHNCFLFLDMMQFHPGRPKGLLSPLFHYTDAVHCNEKETMANTGKDHPEEAIREILEQGAKVIFLTKGDKGAELITQEIRITQPRFEVEFIDATGAGDAFCAGIVHKLIELNEFGDVRKLSENELIEILMMGQAVGASATTAAGCVEGVSKDKVTQIMKEQREAILSGTKVKSSPFK
jgi:sugar/nucleoside kinase (ribokinase family)